MAAATSLPESGSLYPSETSVSPVSSFGSTTSLCMSVPTCATTPATISAIDRPSTGAPTFSSSWKSIQRSIGSPTPSPGVARSIRPRSASARLSSGLWNVPVVCCRSVISGVSAVRSDVADLVRGTTRWRRRR